MDPIDLELTKAAESLANLAKAHPHSFPAMQGDLMTQAEYDSVLEVIRLVGPEGLRKKMPELNERQLLLVKAVLEKAKADTFDAEAKPKTPEVEAKEREGSKDDEKLVKEKITDVKPQGDSSPEGFTGQAVADPGADGQPKPQMQKSESDAALKAIVERIKERKLDKAVCAPGLVALGFTSEAIEKAFGFDAEPPKPEEEKKPLDATDKGKDKADKDADKEVKEGLVTSTDAPKPKAPEAKPAVAAPAPAPASVTIQATPAPEKPMQKAVWTDPNRALHASTRTGRNCHYNVDAAIVEAAEREAEMKKSGTWVSDPYEKRTEPLAKSTTELKTTVNDLIEAGLDFTPAGLELAKSKAALTGKGFTVASFAAVELAKSMNLSPAQTRAFLEQNKVEVAPLEKGLPKGEGARGGHVVGHTTTGKPIYSNPKHPQHESFDFQDHNEAKGAHMKKLAEAHTGEDGKSMPTQKLSTDRYVMANHHAKAAGYHGNEMMKKLAKTPAHEIEARHKAARDFAAPTPEASQTDTTAAPGQQG